MIPAPNSLICHGLQYNDVQIMFRPGRTNTVSRRDPNQDVPNTIRCQGEIPPGWYPAGMDEETLRKQLSCPGGQLKCSIRESDGPDLVYVESVRTRPGRIVVRAKNNGCFDVEFELDYTPDLERVIPRTTRGVLPGLAVA